MSSREEKWRSGQHFNLRPENGASIHLNGTFGHLIIMKNVSVSTRTGEGSILCRGRNLSPTFTSKLVPTQSTIGSISSTKRLQGKVTALVHLRVRDQKRAELSTLHWVTLKLLIPSGYLCTTWFNIQEFYVLPTQCSYVFCTYLRTSSDYFSIQH